MSVLILAEDVDATADEVVRALGERAVPVHRVNTAWFPSQLRLDARLQGHRWTGVLQTPSRRVELEEVTAVWYRSPRAYRFPSGLSDAERAHAALEAKYGLGGVLASLPALWVNHPARLADAAYKPVQLVTARRCGLNVPDTLITQDAGAVRLFAEEGASVTKLLGSNTLVEQGLRKLAFTQLLDRDGLADLRGIEVTTHLVQRWVPKAYEVRLIVIGTEFTAAAIRSATPQGHLDWRADHDGAGYDLVPTPAAVRSGVAELMQIMDLRYAALDFVVTPGGEWVFLEINAGGQFGWIQERTGAPLIGQLADLLARGIR
ncbi:MAG: ATP-grasp ribosomal peptide maturase [Pseudonocardia sp.]|nr:ATP-grasp ribosomal peptide maturase [Pseudonocardia sp.]